MCSKGWRTAAAQSKVRLDAQVTLCVKYYINALGGLQRKIKIFVLRDARNGLNNLFLSSVELISIKNEHINVKKRLPRNSHNFNGAAV